MYAISIYVPKTVFKTYGMLNPRECDSCSTILGMEHLLGGRLRLLKGGKCGQLGTWHGWRAALQKDGCGSGVD